MSDLKIPDDLKTWHSVACDKVHFATDYDAIRTLIERIAVLEAEKDAALEANELDRRRLWGIVQGIEEEITGRMWIIEGRGSYEWDDNRYRKEFGWAISALQKKLEPLRKIAHDLADSPKNQKGVDEVRRLETLKDENDNLRKHVEQFMIALASIGHECREATAEDSTVDEIEMQEILSRVADGVNGLSLECSVLLGPHKEETEAPNV